jgi:hypothetical protein
VTARDPMIGTGASLNGAVAAGSLVLCRPAGFI